MEDIAAKKKAIFEATLELIKEHGFHGTPMSLVAKNAGVAAGTIYHYFESKDQLINDLYQYCRTMLIELVNPIVAESASYKEKFFNMWMCIFEFYTQHMNVLVFFEQYINSPYYADKNPDHLQDKPLYNFLVEGVKKGVIKSVKPEILLLLIHGSITSSVKLNSFGNIRLNKNDFKKITEILWDGIAVS